LLSGSRKDDEMKTFVMRSVPPKDPETVIEKSFARTDDPIVKNAQNTRCIMIC